MKRRLAEYAAANFTVMLGTAAAPTHTWSESVLAMVAYGEQFGIKIVPGVRQSGIPGVHSSMLSTSVQLCIRFLCCFGCADQG